MGTIRTAGVARGLDTCKIAFVAVGELRTNTHDHGFFSKWKISHTGLEKGSWQKVNLVLFNPQLVSKS